MPEDAAALTKILLEATPATLDVFHEQMCRRLYDAEAGGLTQLSGGWAPARLQGSSALMCHCKPTLVFSFPTISLTKHCVPGVSHSSAPRAHVTRSTSQAVMQGLDLSHKPATLSLQQWVAKGAQAFYANLLTATNQVDPMKTQSETALEQVTPALVAQCVRRMSLGAGLPGDGQVLHSLLQGLFQFIWGGPPECPHQAQCMAESESTWNLASSKLAQIILGESASGKDNCIELLCKLIAEVRDDKRCVLSQETVLTQGSVTMSGVLKILERNRGFLCFVNSEVESLLNRRKEQYLSEQDLVHLLDGANVGKATSMETKVIPRPHCWAALGCQQGVYLREFVGDSCARLRFVVTTLSADASQGESFAQKMLSRRASQALIVNMLRQTLNAQHRLQDEGEALRLRRRRRTRGDGRCAQDIFVPRLSFDSSVQFRPTDC